MPLSIQHPSPSCCRGPAPPPAAVACPLAPGCCRHHHLLHPHYCRRRCPAAWPRPPACGGVRTSPPHAPWRCGGGPTCWRRPHRWARKCGCIPFPVWPQLAGPAPCSWRSAATAAACLPAADCAAGGRLALLLRLLERRLSPGCCLARSARAAACAASCPAGWPAAPGRPPLLPLPSLPGWLATCTTGD